MEVLDRILWRGYKIDLIADHNGAEAFGYRVVDPGGTVLTECFGIADSDWFNEPVNARLLECRGIIDGDIAAKEKVRAVP